MAHHTTTFDTLKYANILKSAGVPEKQAGAHTKVQAAIIDEKLASKRDISELKQHIKEMELHMTIKLC